MGLFNKKTKEETLIVEGMKCIHCSKKVIDALNSIKVKGSISLENKTVTIKYDENKVDLNTIKQTINDLGFICK